MGLLLKYIVMDKAQKGACHQAIGKSRGGMTTKIMAMVDALGNLVDFTLLKGQSTTWQVLNL